MPGRLTGVPAPATSLRRRLPEQAGATSIEFIAMLPFVVALALAAWQGVVAGQAAWLSGGAAGAAARAAAVGTDPKVAARGALPAALRSGVRVRVKDGEVTVRVPIRTVVGRARLGTISARALLRDQGA